ncbi:glycosyltransferase family 2 protein [Streptomyces sp. NPDC020412]|uniref:glycosyltransferase family 2 protein n=1 Tax=Streptomyces sp. NPDC020412 TaxID=3365073 RepID=UPI00379A4B74
MTAVSVVVPTRDKPDSLRLALACLAVQTCPAPMEVVVVDDGSGSDTRDVVAAATGALPHTLNMRTVPGPLRGRAAARNAGAAASLGDVLLFLDDDVLLPPTAVRAHLAAQVRRLDTCVHGPVHDLPGARRLLRAVEVAGAVPADPYGAATGGAYGRTVVTALERFVAETADGRVPPVAPWLTCVGANTSMPRALWRRAGGFDESFGTTWGCEDLELGRRLWSLGAGMRLEGAAPGVHLTHERPDRWQQHAVNLSRFVAKHPEPAVRALTALLGPAGTSERYLTALYALESEYGAGTECESGSDGPASALP